MPTIAQAQTQVKSAKTELEKAKLEAEQREADIKAAKIESQKRFQEKTRIGTISSQLRIAGEVGAGAVGGEIPRRRRLARKEFQQTQQKISFAEEELGGFQEQLSEREAEIGGVEMQIGRVVEEQKIQKALQEDITAANEAFRRGSLKPGASKRTVNLFKALIAKARGAPTSTEIALQQSLPTELRGLPPSGFQTLELAPQKLDSIIKQSLMPVQTLAPITSFATLQVPKGEGLGGVILKRTELEAIRQQSFPLETTGIVPKERIQEFTFKEFLVTEIPPIRETRKGLFEIGGKISERAEVIGKTLAPLSLGIPDIISKDREQRLLVKQEAISLGVKGLGFGVRATSESLRLIETPGSIAITGVVVATSILAPPVVGGIIGVGVTGLGVKGVLDPTLTLEERAFSGAVAGLGGFGVVAGATPFIRGFGAKGVKKASEGFEVITDIKGIGDIGLIQPKRGAKDFVDLPKESPLVRGGFGVKEFEKTQFLGKDQFLATSQRGLFEVGKDIPIEKKFFVTPQEPTLKIGETRISRLGLTDLSKFPESIEIGFGLPPTPQIGITKGQVARTEKGGAFAIGKGTELEAIRTTGLISGVEKIGKVRIKGQGVDIFRFETTPSRGVSKGILKEDLISTGRTTRVPAESVLSSLIGTTRGISFPIRSSLTFKSPFLSKTTPTRTTRDISIRTPPSSIFRTPPTPPTKTPGTPGIPRLPRIPSLPLFEFGFEDPFKQVRKRRIGTAKRKPLKKKKKLEKGFDVRLAPSFTAIVQDLRGQFPKEISFGKVKLGISPRQIRVIPNRRRKKR